MTWRDLLMIGIGVVICALGVWAGLLVIIEEASSVFGL